MDHLKAEHEAIRIRLQGCYAGEARQYDLTRRDNGQLFPPVGMCYADIVLSKVDMYQREVDTQRSAIERLERELAATPYVPDSPHPMIRLLSTPAPSPDAHVQMRHRAPQAHDTRRDLINQIGVAHAGLLMAQEHLSFWISVKPASDAFLKELADLFDRKRALRAQLFEEHGAVVAEW